MSTLALTPSLPWQGRLASGLLAALGAIGLWPLDPERLLDAAFAAEGSDDLGPGAEQVREGLRAYCESARREAHVHGLGRFYLSRRMCGISLRARLRIAPDARAGLRPRQAPLVVCGLPRSGTTVLHRLLTLPEDSAGLPFWQLVDPMPPPRGADRRRALAALSLDRLARLSGNHLDAQHLIRVDLPDECGQLLRTGFVGSMLWQVPAHGWLRWYLDQDLGAAYRVWAAYLARLEPQGPRLVLKDPFHCAHLPELFAACPGAMVVQTHRDPLQTVPSFHKLCASMHRVLVSDYDLPAAVASQTRWLAAVARRTVERRPADARVYDLEYADLLADPVAAALAVRRHFGLPVSDRDEQAMRAWLAEHGQRKHGPNPYTIEAFGQRPEELAEAFSTYQSARGYP